MNKNKTELIFGDFLSVAAGIPDNYFDMMLGDLPYGTTNCKWDSPIDLVQFWKEAERIVKPNGAIVLTAQTPFDKALGASNLKHLRYEWIWEKTQATGHLNAKKAPMKAHENILVFYRNQPTYNPQKTNGHKPINSYTKYVATQNKTALYNTVNKEITGGGETDRYPRSVQVFPSDKQREYFHSTQKPVALFEYMIRTYTNPGDKVIDPTVGSGTTLVACQNTGRIGTGVENDRKIYEVAYKRLTTL